MNRIGCLLRAPSFAFSFASTTPMSGSHHWAAPLALWTTGAGHCLKRSATRRHRVTKLLETVRANEAREVVSLDAANDNPTLAVWLRRPEAQISRLLDWITRHLGEAPRSWRADER